MITEQLTCWNSPSPLGEKMSTNGKFLNLSSDVIRLVNDGVYSLYSLNNSANYILITDSRVFYLLDEKGNVQRKLDSLSGYTVKAPIRLDELSKHSGFKVNYA